MKLLFIPKSPIMLTVCLAHWACPQSPDLHNRELVPDNGNRTRVCRAMHDLGMQLRNDHIGVVRRKLVDERLGNQRTTGAWS